MFILQKKKKKTVRIFIGYILLPVLFNQIYNKYVAASFFQV